MRVALYASLSLALTVGGCSINDLAWPAMGPLTGQAGYLSFRFGAASAATQIEDQNPNTDWFLFTKPVDQGGLGKGKGFVGQASLGYSNAIADIDLLKQAGLESYRFSIEWARIEPTRGQIDEAALAHYSELLDALIAAKIRPMVTVHHFSMPVWIDDPRDVECTSGPSDANLCGLGHPTGGPQVVAAMSAYAKLLAERFGDRVDEWGTINEPINYLFASHGTGTFPPGKANAFDLLAKFMPAARDLFAAHVGMYKAIKAADTIDADGDGVAAAVGVPLSVIEWEAAAKNKPSTDPADVAARDKIKYLYHYFLVDSLKNGTFDADLDGTGEESHPDWKDSIDWLGAQYYFRTGVTGTADLLIPVINLVPCFPPFDFGACLPPGDPTHCVPTMGYEFHVEGLRSILVDFSKRWPGLPLVVSEGGIATEVGARRAENIVRTLEMIEAARILGADVRGYYHWSLFDNFEWAEAFGPRFGLFSVDYTTFVRTPTAAVPVLHDIASRHSLSSSLRKKYGGTGKMTPEPTVDLEKAKRSCQGLLPE